MKKYILLLGIVVCLSANTKTGMKSGREFQIKRHNVNQVEMCVSNFGKFGQDETGSAGCWWPIGTDHTYIYGAGLWFGTIDSLTNDTLVTIGYGPHGSEREVAPGLNGMSPYHPDAIIYMYPDPWPAPPDTFPMAPQDTVSHQDSWCCYNDCDSSYHMPGDTRPIGIEIYQTVYVWDISETEDMIWFTHEVKNVSGDNLQDCYIGICTDNDIGNEAAPNQNDIISGIVGRWYVTDGETLWVDDLGYQWQEVEEPGWTDFPGAIGFDLHQTPFDLVYGQDKDGDTIPDQYEQDSAYYVNNWPEYKWDVDLDGVPDWRDPSQWPQLGMTAFKRFSLQVEPNLDPDRYMTLAGYNFLTGEYEPYDTIPPDPDDQRFLMSSGPFELEADSSVTIVFAVLFADWHNIYQTPDSALVLVDATAQLYYDMYWFLYTGVEEYSAAETFNSSLMIYPNPAKTFFTIHTAAAVQSIRIYDVLGELIKAEDLAEFTNEHRISLKGMSSGVYFLKVNTEDTEFIKKLIVTK